VKILLADDHAVLRKGLSQLLADEFPGIIIGEAANGKEALDEIAFQRWDALVLDLYMPDSEGLAVLDEVRRQQPALPVLVLSSAPEEQMAMRVLKAGANGYLNKQCAAEELVKALTKIVAGGRYFSAATMERLAEEMSRAGKTPREELSDRESTVLRMLVAGKSVRDIALDLGISPKTASTFHTRIWRKLGVRNDIEMIRRAEEKGLL